MKVDSSDADRVVDALAVASGLTVILSDIETMALIFSLSGAGVYYFIRAWVAWKGRD